MDELTEVATMDEVLNFLLELVTIIRVMATFMVEATVLAVVAVGAHPHQGRPLQVYL